MTVRLFTISLISLFLPCSSFAQTKKPFVFVNVVSDVGDPNSQAVVPLLKRAMTQTGLFEVVSDDDSKLNLVVVADCYRDSVNDPFSCSYISNYVGASHKTLIGGGIVVQPSARQGGQRSAGLCRGRHRREMELYEPNELDRRA